MFKTAMDVATSINWQLSYLTQLKYMKLKERNLSKVFILIKI